MSKPEQFPAIQKVKKILSETAQEQWADVPEQVTELLNDPDLRQSLDAVIKGNKDTVSNLQQFVQRSTQLLVTLLLSQMRSLPPVLWEIAKDIPDVLGELEQDNDRKERIKVYRHISNVLVEQLQISPLIAYLAVVRIIGDDDPFILADLDQPPVELLDLIEEVKQILLGIEVTYVQESTDVIRTFLKVIYQNQQGEFVQRDVQWDTIWEYASSDVRAHIIRNGDEPLECLLYPYPQKEAQ